MEKNSSPKHRSLFESLEERVLFDGVTDAPMDPSGSDVVPPIVPAQTQQINQQEQETPKELVIVDAGVENYEELVSELVESRAEGSLEFRVLNSHEDGVSQITEILSESNSQFQAIHILSHGNEGEVHLGDTTLSGQNLDQYTDQLASWSDYLTGEADLLFYGCDLAGNSSGESLLASVSAITGADVAASDDLTGDSEQGGDWDLEFTVGTLEATALSAAGWQGVLAGAVPTVTLDVPPEDFINESFQFTATFENASPTDVGFAPFIDLSAPPGIDITAASFLGSPVTLFNVGTFDASGNLVDGAGNPVTHPLTDLPVTGTAGETFYVAELPFGSFAPGQEPATITFDATAESANGAMVGVPLDLDATPGFAFGCDALDNSDTDPPINGATVTDTFTPQVIDLVKTSDAPEGETATGPNFPITYTLTVDIANGETITGLDILDSLPDSFVYLGGTLTVDASAATASSGITIVDQPVAGAPQNAPDNDFLIEVGSVTGSAADNDIVVEYTIFIDQFDADGNPVIDAASGDDALTINDSSVTGTYLGLTVGDDDALTDLELSQQSIATQKGVTIVDDVGAPGSTPGDTLEYTIDVQVSDFFEFSNVFLDDNFSDGQMFDTSFGPTFVINEGGVTTSGAFSAANFSVTNNTPGDGTTDVFFDIAAEVPDGVLTGDLFADATLDGGTTVTVTFRTVIQEDFTDSFNSGDTSVDTGDILTNDVTVTGTLPSGETESDTGSASVQIEGPAISKSIYALDGDQALVGEPIVAGHTITYRIQFDMATADFENLVITDFLPLPLYDATEITTLSTTATGTSPPAGTVTYGPTHDLDVIAGVTPTIVTNATSNSLSLDFGSFDVEPSVPATIDLLFTVTAQDVLIGDGLFITNQANASFGTTNNGLVSSDAIVQNEVAAPALVLSKGVVSTTAISPTFDPGAVGPVAFAQPGAGGTAFGGGINSTNLATNPIDSNLIDADAGDLVKFAIVIENTGGADGFDLLIQDSLPPEFLIPGSGLNLEVRDGDGNLIPFTGAPADLFGAGIELLDPGALSGAANSFDEATAAGDGSNIIVITYDVELAVAITPDTVYTNTAEIDEFGAVDGGNDHTAGSSNPDWVDDATVETLGLSLEKSIVTTSEIHTGFVNGIERVTIGEIVRYRLVTELPEATIDSLVLRDILPAGLEFINDGTSTVAIVSNGGGVTSTAFGGLGVNVGAGGFVAGNETNVSSISPTFALGDNNIGSTASTNSNTDNFGSGTDVYFKLGTIANADNDADSEFVVIEFNALVLNDPGSNDQNDLRNNRFRAQDGDGVGDDDPIFGDSNNIGIRITEPEINNVNKIVTPTTGDAGDVVTFTVTFSNDPSPTRSDAFDVNVVDGLPPDFVLIPGSVAVAAAGGATGVTDNTAGNVIDIDIDQMPIGSSITITYQATLISSVQPGQVVTNEANVTYTSLPEDGTVTNPTGSVTPGASGAGDGERDGSGGLNDYSDSDQAHVTIFAPTLSKSLVSTGIVSSGNTNDQAVIGETATYEVELVIPEGVINAAELIDTLDLGLSFVSLDSIVTSADVASDLYNLNDPTSIPTSSAGQSVTFDLGTITNSNNDNSVTETITLQYTVIIDNIVDNQSGDALDNSVQLSWTLNGMTQMSNADDAEDIQIIEPDLEVNKSVSAASADAGDPVTFTIVIGHSGISDTDAFDVTFSDPVPPEISFTFADVTTTHSNLGDISSLFQQTGNTLETIPGSSFDLLVGETVTIEITGTINQTVTPGQTLSNTATAEFTSLDGDDPNERDGDDGQGGALDDYEADSTAALTIIGFPTLTKDIVNTSINDTNNDDTEVVIGELVQYRLLVTLPEATIPGASFLDNLDLGLEFVSLDSVTAFSGAATNPATITSSVGAFTSTSAFNPTVTGDGIATAQSLDFDFGTIINSDNDNTTVETLEVIYTAPCHQYPDQHQ